MAGYEPATLRMKVEILSVTPPRLAGPEGISIQVGKYLLNLNMFLVMTLYTDQLELLHILIQRYSLKEINLNLRMIMLPAKGQVSFAQTVQHARE